jgi:predicted DNA repair protein MutK
MIKRIAIGSLRNKLLFILPGALLLSQFAPWLLTPILMLGGTYLSFEGAEKIWEKISGHHAAEEAPAAAQGAQQEEQMVAGAIRTDFILSAEIMVIALNEVASEGLLQRAIILTVVAIVITIGVYGVVALIVKMDDIGLHLAGRQSSAAQRVGELLVKGMPKLLKALALVGTIAMLWVGGHILLVGADTLGWHTPYGLVHHAEEAVAHATGALGGVLGWLTNTLGSAIAGLLVGAVVVAILHLIPRKKKADAAASAGH